MSQQNTGATAVLTTKGDLLGMQLDFTGARTIERIPVGADGLALIADSTLDIGVRYAAPAPGGPAGGDLTGTYPNPLIANNVVTNAKLADMAANTVKSNPTAALADPQDLTVGANTVLGRQGGNIVAAQVATGQVADDAVTNTKLANMAANTVKSNPTAGVADPQDLTVGANTVLGRQGGNIVAAQVATGQVADDAVTNAKLANMPANTIKGNNTGGVADPLDLTVAQVRAMLGLNFGNGTYVWAGKTGSVGHYFGYNETPVGGAQAGLDQNVQGVIFGPGTITKVAYNTRLGDATTKININKNGVTVASFFTTGGFGVATVSIAVAAADKIAFQYDSGTAPQESSFTVGVA